MVATPKGRPAFLHTEPPPGYIAGHGRGAKGFTTRSDIGPANAAAIGAAGLPDVVAPNARPAFHHTNPPLNYIAGHARGATGFTTRSDIGPARSAAIGAAGPPEVGRGRGVMGFNTRSGIGPARAAAIGAAGPPDVGRGRGKGKKGFVEKQKLDEFEAASNLKITEQKRKLSTTQEWDSSIPEVGVNNSLRNKTNKKFESFSLISKKKKRIESFVPVPDTQARNC